VTHFTHIGRLEHRGVMHKSTDIADFMRPLLTAHHARRGTHRRHVALARAEGVVSNAPDPATTTTAPVVVACGVARRSVAAVVTVVARTSRRAGVASSPSLALPPTWLLLPSPLRRRWRRALRPR